MKKWFLFLMIVLASCHWGGKDLSGTYVRAIDHEFAVGSDTLIVQPVDKNNYRIEKRSGYRRIINGKLQKPESHRENWLGVYDPEHQAIREIASGKVLRVSADGNTVWLGSVEYHRTGAGK